MEQIRTHLVYGFLDAGKTSYIQDCIFNDYFHKRGSTLIAAFEEGETEYDIKKLKDFRTDVIYYEKGNIEEFLLSAIEQYHPDRIYLEMNIMKKGLREQLPDCLDIVFAVTLLEGSTLALYYNNMRQLIQKMITDSRMVIFNRCENKASLEPYGIPFRLMNNRCDFLWQSAMGYSEKAFPRFLPYDVDAPVISLSDEEYAIWHLDAQDYPERYAGKQISFDAQVRNREREDLPKGCVFLGRSVMTCCLMDIQFLGVECFPAEMKEDLLREGNWLHIAAEAVLQENKYRVKYIVLKPVSITPIAPPVQSIIGFA